MLPIILCISGRNKYVQCFEEGLYAAASHSCYKSIYNRSFLEAQGPCSLGREEALLVLTFPDGCKRVGEAATEIQMYVSAGGPPAACGCEGGRDLLCLIGLGCHGEFSVKPRGSSEGCAGRDVGGFGPIWSASSPLRCQGGVSKGLPRVVLRGLF